MLKVLENLKYEKVVADTLVTSSEYGFDQPEMTVTVSLSDGTDVYKRQTLEYGANAGLTMNPEEIRVNNRTLYYSEDSYTGAKSVSFLMKDQLIDITGDISRELMIDIAIEININ